MFQLDTYVGKRIVTEPRSVMRFTKCTTSIANSLIYNRTDNDLCVMSQLFESKKIGSIKNMSLPKCTTKIRDPW